MAGRIKPQLSKEVGGGTQEEDSSWCMRKKILEVIDREREVVRNLQS